MRDEVPQGQRDIELDLTATTTTNKSMATMQVDEGRELQYRNASSSSAKQA